MLVAVGVHQKRATVAQRERVAVAGAALRDVLSAYAALDGVDEVMVLSTCCRVEVYVASSCPAAAALELRRALVRRAGSELPLFELVGDEAFRHLVRVASSLESAVLGEPQVLGQVKEAFQGAVEAGFAGPELTAATSRAFAAAKRVRSETAVGRAGVSWGHAVAELAGKVLGPLAGLRAAVVGAGEMARLSARHLAERGASLVILNRTLAGAEALAREVGGDARGLDDLDEEVARADVVVSAAPVALPVFRPEAMARLVRARRRRIVLVDLAVPRAVPAETARVPDVYLCDVDDLDRMMHAAQDLRAAAAAQADAIVEEEVLARSRAEAERRAAPLIAEIRTRAAAIAKDEVERTLRRLGEDPELATRLDALAGAIVSKLLHVPSARLRQAARDGEGGEALVAAAVEIFDLGAGHARDRERAAS